MYCKYCGEKISDEAKVCTKCSKPIQASEKKKTSSIFKNKKIVGIGIAIVGILVFIAVISLSNNYVEIDMSKLYDITFSGLDGEGVATVEINQSEWSRISDEIVKEGDSTETSILMSLQTLEYTLSKEDALSNDDEIVFTVNFPEEYYKKYKIKAKNIEQKIKVEGLIVPEEIDVFEGLEVEFSGRSPFITCNIITDGCNDFTKKYVTFNTKENYYSNGDTVEVVASYDSEDLLEAKVKVIKNEAQYEAESKESYLESIENVDLTQLQQDIYNQLQLEYSAADELFCGVELGWTNHYTDLKSEQEKGNVFLALKDKYSFDEEEVPYNIYAMCYRTKIGVEHRSSGNEGTFETEIDILLLAQNLYVDENNVLHYDDLIQVRADEVDSVSDLKSVYIKEKQNTYQVIEEGTDN